MESWLQCSLLELQHRPPCQIWLGCFYEKDYRDKNPWTLRINKNIRSCWPVKGDFLISKRDDWWRACFRSKAECENYLCWALNGRDDTTYVHNTKQSEQKTPPHQLSRVNVACRISYIGQSNSLHALHWTHVLLCYSSSSRSYLVARFNDRPHLKASARCSELASLARLVTVYNISDSWWYRCGGKKCQSSQFNDKLWILYRSCKAVFLTIPAVKVSSLWFRILWKKQVSLRDGSATVLLGPLRQDRHPSALFHFNGRQFNQSRWCAWTLQQA